DGMVKHGAIPTAPDVVLARPDEMDRSFASARLQDGRRLGDIVGVRRGATAERPAGPESVNLYLIGAQAEDGGGGALLHGLKLRSGPDFATVRSFFDRAVQRLHRSMSQIGKSELCFDRFRAFRENRIGVALLQGGRARRSGELLIFVE